MAGASVSVAPAATYYTGTALTGTTAHPAAASKPTTAEKMGQQRWSGAGIHVRLRGRGVAVTGTFALYGYDADVDEWSHIADLNGGQAITIASQANAYVDTATCNYKEYVPVQGASSAYRVRSTAQSAASTWTPAYGTGKG